MILMPNLETHGLDLDELAEAAFFMSLKVTRRTVFSTYPIIVVDMNFACANPEKKSGKMAVVPAVN